MVDLGKAQGSLTLNASGFFSSIQSAVTELHNITSASSSASGAIGDLENSMSGAGGGLAGAMSNLSGSASSAAGGIENVGDAAGTASEDTDDFKGKLGSAWESIKNLIPDTETLSTKLEAFGKKAQSVGKDLSKYITTPLVGIGIYSVNTSMNFEKAMSQVQATMGATKEDMVDLEAAAKKMGETTQFTNIEAAQALNYLALAGYNSEQMIAALPSVLNLAAAGGMDLADASDMLTDGLSALNLASEDSDELMANMTTMVDQMAKTASSSNTSVSQLGDAILTVGGTASYLDGGLSEVNQVLGLMADRGIKASEAGTHLRNIILAMQPATDDAKAAFLDVGLATKDAEGNFVNLAYNADGSMKSLQEIFQILQEGMADMSDMEKQSTLADIFHRTDLAAANALIGTSVDRWNELGDAIENSGGAGSQMAATQLDNLSGKMTLLKSQADGLATTIGETLAPTISDLLDDVSKLISKFSQLDPETQKTIVKFGLFAIAIGPVVSLVGTLATGLSGAITVVRGLGTALGAIKGSALVSAIGGALGQIPGLVSSMFSSLGSLLSSGFSALLEPVTASIGTVLAGIGAFLAGFGIGTLIYDAIGPEIDEVLHPIFDVFVEAWDSVSTLFTETIPQAFSDFVEFISEKISAIGDFFSGVFSAIGGFFSGLASSVAETVSSIWNGIVSVFSAIGAWVYNNVIQPVLSVVVPIVTKIWEIFAKLWEIFVAIFSVVAKWVYDNIISPVISFFRDLYKDLKEIFETVVDLISDAIGKIVEWFQAGWDGIVAIFSAIGTWFSDRWQDIKDVFSGVGTWFKSTFTTGLDAIKEIFSAIGTWFSDRWDDITDVFSEVGTWFKDKFSAAVDGIKEVFGGISDWFSDLWDDITGLFGSVAETVSTAFQDAFAAVFNGAMETVEGIINFFVDGVNNAIDVINAIPGVEISPLEGLSLPRLAVGLDYVPYDDYQALLHKGERVLTREENEQYSNNQSTGGGDTFIFNSPEPIDEEEAARQMKEVKQAMAEGF